MEENLMSLLSEAMENCIFLTKTKVPDGYGGYVDTYTDGAEFKAAITFDTSIQARVGEKEGVTSLYTVTTGKEMVLEYHDVFKRVRDGKIFRVTSDGDDKYTPASASLNMRQVTAEEFVPSGGGA
jgi:hypothetical protein